MLPDKSPDARGTATPRLLHGRYELGEKIGDGSFFAVFRGRDAQTGRSVAVKVLNEQYASDREFTDRLREETLAVVPLDHPHIVSVSDVWMEGERVAIATEYIRGIDLKERVRRVAPFPLAVAIDIAAAISEALEYATSLGIAHGDLRPENILVTPEGQVKLTDFGLGAAVTASSRLQMSALVHSAHYLPPEVAQGKLPTPASDVYSLGAILFEMLSGQPPFLAESPFAIAVKHLHDPPPALRRHNPGVPKAVEGIVLKCLQKEPAARYPNPGALLADLRGVREALRYGKPLTWTPGPEPAAVAPAKAAEAAPRPTRPRPAPRSSSPPVSSASAAPAVTGGEPSTRLLLLLPLMALVLAGVVFMIFVLGTRAPKDAVVPHVVGMTQDEAARRLTDEGLLMRVAKENYDDRVAPGTVQSTYPPEGMQVKQGKAIEVWVSKGPQPAVVPNLIGLPEAEARVRIREGRLKVGPVKEEFDETTPRGTILSQEPAAQTEVTPKSDVSFVVSKGPEPTLPPEPATPPEAAPTTQGDRGTTDPSGLGPGATDTSGAAGTDGGTMTDPSGAGATQGLADSGAPPNKERQFDVTTKIEPGSGKSRLRIIVTDDQGRRQALNDLYLRGQTVHNSVKARGAPGSVRIEVYENGQLVKHMQY